MAEAVITAGDVDALSCLTQHMAKYKRYRRNDYDTWKTNTLPILWQIVAKIESIRTDQWQCDPNRKPGVLLDTF
jgi:hypothetical protein